VSREQRRAQQRRLTTEIRAGIAEVVQQAIEAALQAEVAALLGRPKYARRTTGSQAPSGVRCGHCGATWGARFWRAGSYQRTLLTVVAAITVRVPRLSCRCGHSLRLAFATFAPYARCWGDVEERARELAGLCVSLRDARAILAWESGQPLACSTLQRWGHQAGAVAAALQAGPLERVPPVVLFDGLWVKLMVRTGDTYTDATGRARPQLKRVKVPLLVAYGVDPATGERWLVDWERGDDEDQASWQRLLERLWSRGLHTANGLVLCIHDGSSGLEAAFQTVDLGPGLLRQRCVFHVLKNIRDSVRGAPGMDRAARAVRRREVLADAAAIWQGTTAAAVQRAWGAFRTTWQGQEAEAVATGQRVFRATLAYLAALARGRERGETWDPRYLRTTSALERVNRAFRQKARQVGVFQAEAGLVAAVALVAAHRQLLHDQAPDDLWTEALETGLLAQ
jgi:transposase-like protein